MSNIMQTEMVVFRNMHAYVHTYVHVQQLVEKRGQEVEGK